eukprot:3004550-Rhodomonas_salina.8
MGPALKSLTLAHRDLARHPPYQIRHVQYWGAWHGTVACRGFVPGLEAPPEKKRKRVAAASTIAGFTR